MKEGTVRTLQAFRFSRRCGSRKLIDFRTKKDFHLKSFHITVLRMTTYNIAKKHRSTQQQLDASSHLILRMMQHVARPFALFIMSSLKSDLFDSATEEACVQHMYICSPNSNAACLYPHFNEKVVFPFDDVYDNP